MGALFGIVFMLLWLAFVVAIVVGLYKTFAKMGYDNAWWLFIPILQFVFVVQFLDKPMWWIVLCFIPIVNLYIAWLVAEKVANAYGKSTGYAVGLLLLGGIFYPLLGLTNAQPTRQV